MTNEDKIDKLEAQNKILYDTLKKVVIYLCGIEIKEAFYNHYREEKKPEELISKQMTECLDKIKNDWSAIEEIHKILSDEKEDLE